MLERIIRLLENYGLYLMGMVIFLGVFLPPMFLIYTTSIMCYDILGVGFPNPLLARIEIILIAFFTVLSALWGIRILVVGIVDIVKYIRSGGGIFAGNEVLRPVRRDIQMGEQIPKGLRKL